jgi:hypothetical protein
MLQHTWRFKGTGAIIDCFSFVQTHSTLLAAHLLQAPHEAHMWQRSERCCHLLHLLLLQHYNRA